MSESGLVPDVSKRLAFEKSYIKKSSRKFRRNITRRIRRKKSKWRVLQKKRDKNLINSDNLCGTVSVGITDMDINKDSTYSTAFTDVADWQKQHQIAYWKSRALSLEYENKMLLQHIRNVYAKQIIDYQNAQYLEENCEEEEQEVEEEEITEHSRKQYQEKMENRSAPEEQVGKKHKEEMKRLYGDKSAKIIGMETAVQLNYDLVVDKNKPVQWPNIPLNLN